MKAMLEFDIENPEWKTSETELEKLKCAKKGWEMSGFIDSFLDYLLVVAPHIPMDKLLNDLTSMYYNKLHDYEIIDMLESDLQEVAQGWDYETEEAADEILQKLQDDYVDKKLEKLTEGKNK